ncbi:MAG: DUF1501 domain-containing protein [Verrucomicrobiota bacterium]|nr:DUF1501 domain-containing protein [Verrucomicrobiota bacterium]
MPSPSQSRKKQAHSQMQSRRDFLRRSGGGLGGIALAGMLGRDGALANTASARQPIGLHHAPKAKRVIQLFMGGAASHVDLFDFKPELIKRHEEKWDPGETVELFQSSPGKIFKSPWEWAQHGQCGKPLTSIVSELGQSVDDIAFIHNVVGKTGVHSQATYLQATGFQRPGFPGIGAWVSYGMGSLNDNLPTFVVLPDHRGYASNGPKNWSSAFLPASHQGTTLFPGRANPIADLHPPEKSFITAKSEAATQSLLSKFNRAHAANRETDSRLDARIKSYELAARMQLSAPEALDISSEPTHIKRLYGLDHNVLTWPKEINEIEEIDHFSRKCLVARRLLERGVRFIQIWSGNDNGFPRRNWDSHEDIRRDHGPLARGMARGTAALMLDLKQRGMLEDTLILWTTEFGRMPCAQGSKGRDHNPFVFTNWLTGGGIRGGVTQGESDEWGFRPADKNNPTSCHDIHATILHQLGINHERLTVRHDGIDRRLTDVHGHVIHPILA